MLGLCASAPQKALIRGSILTSSSIPIQLSAESLASLYTSRSSPGASRTGLPPLRTTSTITFLSSALFALETESFEDSCWVEGSWCVNWTRFSCVVANRSNFPALDMHIGLLAGSRVVAIVFAVPSFVSLSQYQCPVRFGICMVSNTTGRARNPLLRNVGEILG